MDEENKNQTDEQQSQNTAAQTDNTAADNQQDESGVEVDPIIDSGEQVSAAAQNQQETGSVPVQMPAAAPLPAGIDTSPTGQPLELADDSNVNVSLDSNLQYNAINPEGDAKITFANGNFNTISQIPQHINQKIATITNTVIPLAEAGLIELLGNSKAYTGSNFNAMFNFINGEPQFQVNVEYSVKSWIGTDIDQQYIAEDANYLLNRLKVVPNVQWNEVSIDCTEGICKLSFII